MKRAAKRWLSILLTAGIICGLMMQPVMAAGNTRRCYTISSGNTTAYSNTGLSKKLGTIYGSDELTVLSVTDRYTRVTYPISGGRTKTGYIATSAILRGTTGPSYKSTGKITTYRRPGGSSYGYVAKGDTVKVLGASGNYTQVKYPVSGGYKYGWVTTTNANQYIYQSGNSGNSASISNGTYVITSALSSSRAVDISGGGSANGTNIQLWEKNGTAAQSFKVTSVGSGWYTIRNTASGKALDVAGGVKGSGVNVQLYEYNGTNAQLWRFESAGNGYYYIQNKLGYYLDVYYGKTDNGTNIQVFSKNGGSNQKWKLNSASAGSTTLTNALYQINVSGSYITCGFDGYKNTKGRHEGIDFKRSIGASVYSLTDGVVTRVSAGRTGSSGLSTIAIYNSAANKTVVYLHSAPLSGIKVGSSIKRGQKIATESWRGVSSSSGAHTHVEVRSGKRTAAAKSVNDYTLDNANPKSFWESQGYSVK